MALAAAARAPAQSLTQASNYADEAISVGDGGYMLNFTVLWSSDDGASATISAPGRIDLIDGSGAVAGQLSASLGGGTPSASVSGPGAVANVSGELDQSGGGGTPASGTVSGTWTLTGLAAGAYTLRFWSFQEADSSREASTIWTAAWDGGGGGPIDLPPAPTPAPAAPTDPTPDPAVTSTPTYPAQPAPSAPAPVALPPSVAISAPGGATAGQSLYVSATATAGGNPLQTVILEQSTDGGVTWVEIGATPAAANPTDTVGNPVSFNQPGNVALQALAWDSSGLEATAVQIVSVAPAYVPPVAAVPEVDPVPAPVSVPVPADPVTPDPAAVDPSPSTTAVTAPLSAPAPAVASPAPTPAPTAPAATDAASSIVPASNPPPSAPPTPGVVLTGDGARTLRSDPRTWTTLFLCGAPAP